MGRLKRGVWVRLVAKFEIMGLPPTINSIGRKHWAVKTKMAKKWIGLVWEQCVFHRCAELNLKRAHIELTRCSKIEPDFDGLVSSFKHVLDGLVRAQVIVDDKPSIIGSPKFTWEYAPPAKGKIKIKIFAPDALDIAA